MATRTDKGSRRFFKTVGEAAGVGAYPVCHLKNPADSGYIGILKRIRVDNAQNVGTEKALMIEWGRRDADLSAGSYAAATVAMTAAQDSGGDSALMTASNQDVNDTDNRAEVVFGILACGVNNDYEIRFDLPGVPNSGIVLTEGTGLVFKCRVNDLSDIDIVPEWDERAIL